jgi:predicted ArsR family transcriptional regulator
MTQAELPDDVRRMLLADIESYEDLEALLLLARTPERTWSAEDVAAELKIRAEIAETALERLQARALVAKAKGRYGPVAEEERGTIGRLAQCYDEKRLEVMRQMSANSIERLRNNAIRAFSDAFLLGRRDPDV